ncbi:MAG: hypothetical protein ABIQ30_14970 [Devosia sp.]
MSNASASAAAAAAYSSPKPVTSPSSISSTSSGLSALVPKSDTGKVTKVAAISPTLVNDLLSLGGGGPRSQPTPKGASQFIFPNGMVLRFDISPGQYIGNQGPHINLEIGGTNYHINLK